MRGRSSASLSALFALLAIGGACGGGERSFEAREFVEAANAAGAGILLGPPLESARDDVEVFELRFPSSSATGAGPHTEDDHGGGSLAVADDPAAATAEFRRCEQAVTLVCYRAANVALILEGVDPEERARLDSAIRELASD
ncbi:MAG: hypothetical protein M3383_03835 [Actinomycetota bacterium]|nr:hypothetical protein [Actinomycetota bacterium]